MKSLPEDRRRVMNRVRRVIQKNLPDGYEEGMQYGMITYFIPLTRYADTYNKQPLAYISLACQKNYYSLYLNNVYTDPDTMTWFKLAWMKTGKKLDMGKSCVRFKSLEDIPLDVISKVVARTSTDEFIAYYEANH